MNKVITRYENTLNTIPMRQWTAEEQNFFFAILTQIRDEGQKKLLFGTDQLKEFANYTNRKQTDFRKTMKSLSEKLENLRYREETSKSYKSMVLFQSFEANWEDDLSEISLEVWITDKFEYIVNQLNANFTQFELQEFTNLRSTYSKTMYRHIKQWRTKGVIGGHSNGEIPKEVLFDMLGVPESVQRPSNFNRQVIKPIIDELSPLFEGLKVIPIKAKRTGNPITAYRFSWKQEKTGKYIPDKFNTNNIDMKRKKDAPLWSNSDYQEETSTTVLEYMKKYQELTRKKNNKEITGKELKELTAIEERLATK